MTETVVIVTGATALPPAAVAALPPDAWIIAADSGLDHAREAGLSPAVVVGDLDSISPEGLAWAREHAAIEQHPIDKSATDTELAVDVAIARRPQRLVLVGAGDGTRLDHAVTTIGVLGRSDLAGLQLDGWWGTTRLAVVHGGHQVRLDLPVGTVFSVLALHGEARGVSVTGARWPLDAVTLPPLSGWGVSNETSAPAVTVDVAEGVLTIVIPQEPS
jgi:thiamine pyrophosphokinase